MCILWMFLGLLCLSFRVCFSPTVQASNWTHVLNSNMQGHYPPLKHYKLQVLTLKLQLRLIIIMMIIMISIIILLKGHIS